MLIKKKSIELYNQVIHMQFKKALSVVLFGPQRRKWHLQV